MDDQDENLAMPSDFASSLLNWDDDNDGVSGALMGQQGHQRRQASGDSEPRKGDMSSGASSAFTSSAPSPTPASGANEDATNEMTNEQAAAGGRILGGFQQMPHDGRMKQVEPEPQAPAPVNMYSTSQPVPGHHQAPYGYIQLPQHMIHQQLAFNHQAAVASNAHHHHHQPQQQVAAAAPSVHHQSASVVSAGTSSTISSTTSSSNPSHGASAHSSFLPNQAQHSQQQGAHQHVQMHPLAMQSSSTCPTHIPGALPVMNFNMYPNIFQGHSFLPFMFNPHLQAGSVAPNPQFVTALVQPQQQLHTQHANPQQQEQQQNVQQQHQQQHQQQMAQQQQVQQQRVATVPVSLAPPPRPVVTKASNPLATSSKPSTKAKGKPMSVVATQKAEVVPPFMLFDAPVELRTNFLASQRMYNMPLYQDCNTVHYGMAVNGFHPQLNAQLNPVTCASSSYPLVRLIDGRSNKPKAWRERNEREQKRAQKITELIESLRSSMEKGGWKVEIKSKYHTLSTCADYVKHLMETTQTKEEAVEQARGDLAVSERKLEEKMLERSSSEPESVASSLTASTASMDKERKERRSRQKRKASSAAENQSCEKKARESESSTEECSSGDDQGSASDPGGGRNISLNKMSSSISDVTDSNRGSSDGGCDGPKSRRTCKQDDEDDDDSQPNSSISSTAAVARGEGAHEGEHGRSDVVIRIKKGRKVQVDARKKEITSLESDFDLDYEEVFLASNVPQIIATPAGRFITTNEFFLKATGLTKQEAERLTIFSIVKPEKLSNLFQIVAEALRQDTVERERISNSHETGSSSSDGQSSGHTSGISGSNDEHGSDTGTWDYTAITLPCIAFPSKGERKGVAATHHPNPLYMTVTLMKDPDPGKRCFHCALTDCPGTNCQLGFVTPELLEMLFSETIEEEPQADANSGSGNDGESNAADDIGGKEEHDLDMMMDD